MHNKNLPPTGACSSRRCSCCPTRGCPGGRSTWRRRAPGPPPGTTCWTDAGPPPARPPGSSEGYSCPASSPPRPRHHCDTLLLAGFSRHSVPCPHFGMSSGRRQTVGRPRASSGRMTLTLKRSCGAASWPTRRRCLSNCALPVK